jgi:hypothetical protein
MAHSVGFIELNYNFTSCSSVYKFGLNIMAVKVAVHPILAIKEKNYQQLKVADSD